MENIENQCWGLTEDEVWHSFDQMLTKAQCDDHALTVGSVVYVGEKRLLTTNQFVDANDVIEMMGERASEFVEDSDDYPDVSDEEREELETLLHNWIMKHCPPRIWMPENVREYTLTADDLEGV
jgi:hypothetical protein